MKIVKKMVLIAELMDTDLFQHAIPSVRCNRRFIITHHIAQNRFSVSSEHGKFPATGQLGIGELQRKIRQHHAPETGIIDGDDKLRERS